jgi:hypothetical protein
MFSLNKVIYVAYVSAAAAPIDPHGLLLRRIAHAEEGAPSTVAQRVGLCILGNRKSPIPSRAT